MKKIAQPHQRVPELVAGKAQARPKLRPVIVTRPSRGKDGIAASAKKRHRLAA